MKLSAIAVRRPDTTGMFFLAILVLGLISLSRLAVDQLIFQYTIFRSRPQNRNLRQSCCQPSGKAKTVWLPVGLVDCQS